MFLASIGSVLSSDITLLKPLSLPSSVKSDLNPAALTVEVMGHNVKLQDGRNPQNGRSPSIGIVDFAYTSTQQTRIYDDGTNDLNLRPYCGDRWLLGLQL
ncbi:hypothetical protein Tco_0478431 [Tanacetum coccineum]